MSFPQTEGKMEQHVFSNLTEKIIFFFNAFQISIPPSPKMTMSLPEAFIYSISNYLAIILYYRNEDHLKFNFLLTPSSLLAFCFGPIKKLNFQEPYFF